MRKLVLLALLIPIILFGQENVKFDGVVKINKYANFIQKAYYPNSPFENPYDSLFVIGGISTASGKKFDISMLNISGFESFKLDMSIRPELYQKIDLNSLRKQLEFDSDFREKHYEDKNLICNHILKNIDNLKEIKSIYYTVLVSYKTKGSLYKKFRTKRVFYNTDTKKFKSNLVNIFTLKDSDFYDIYVKFSSDYEVEFYYSYRGSTYSLNRKMVNPTDDYVIKLNIEGVNDGYKLNLEELYLDN